MIFNKILDYLVSFLWLIIIVGLLGIFWNGFAPELFNLPYMTIKASITMSGFVYLIGVFWHSSQN